MNDSSATSTRKSTSSSQYDNNDEIPLETVHSTVKKRLRRKRNKWTLVVTFSSLVLIIIFITIAYLVARQSAEEKKPVFTVCSDDVSCNMTIIETIPDVLHYKEGMPIHEKISTHWMRLINGAKHSINILSFYWSLKDSDVEGGPYNQSDVGKKILDCIANAAKRGKSFFFY